MARRKAKLGIVPRLLKSAITVGVVPACATGGLLVACSQRMAPVVAAMPVVAAYLQREPDPPLTADPLDAGVPDADAGDAGPTPSAVDAGAPRDAGTARTTNTNSNTTAVPLPTRGTPPPPPVVAAFPRGNPDPYE
ncbi:MAG: hypothetical protein U0414_00115 [Polyangiaceae bacterium]